MKVLVTGGSGNVGQTVVSELLTRGHSVRVLDQKPSVQADVEFIGGDVTGDVTNAVSGVDAVVHLAAIPAFKPDIPGIDYMKVNVAGTYNILDTAGRCGVSKVIMAGSDSALGFVFSTHTFSPEYFPIDEEHPLRPQDPYGLSKSLGEELCKSASRRWNMQTVVLRFCWVWFEETYAHHTDILQGDPDTLAKTMWGYVDVRDAAQACRLAIESNDPTPYDAFFITAGDTFSNEPSFELIRRHYPEVQRVSDEFQRQPHRTLFDISRARRVLGYRPVHSWRAEEDSLTA